MDTGANQDGEPARYVAFGGFTNVWTLRAGLSRLGIDLTVVRDDGPAMVPRDRYTPASGDVLFFSEEQSLRHFLDQTDYTFWPRGLSVAVDDKYIFSEALVSLGERPVPFRPLDLAGAPPATPCVIKARRSWHGGDRFIRGYVCHTPQELESRLEDVRARAWGADEFFVQDYLPDGVRNCFSVAGFFDSTRPERSVLIVTRKLLSIASGFRGSGIAVEVVPDPAGLLERTRRLLSAIDYTGPFELEFLHDDQGNYFILEMNPRFWMQHGIFVDCLDNIVLRRYLGDDRASEPPPTSGVTWISSVDLMAMPVKLGPATFAKTLALLARRRWAGERVLLTPPISVALRFLASLAWRRLRDLLRTGGSG